MSPGAGLAAAVAGADAERGCWSWCDAEQPVAAKTASTAAPAPAIFSMPRRPAICVVVVISDLLQSSNWLWHREFEYVRLRDGRQVSLLRGVEGCYRAR